MPMPISGLLVTLSQNPQRRTEALDVMRLDSRITIGPENKNQVAIVTETETAGEDRDLVDSLSQESGVDLVHVVFYDFSDVDEVPTNFTTRQWKKRSA